MVIGLILASLLKKKKKTGQAMPVIPGIFEISHSMPGRIRFRVPALGTRAGSQIQTVQNELPKITEIHSVEINSYSGSIVVQYDVDGIEPYIVCGLLIKVLGLEAHLDSCPQSAVQKELNLIGSAVNQAVYNKTAGALDLTSAFVLLTLSLGLYKIIIQNDRNLPGGINLLWWAYVMAKGRN
jgi:hypothetical protein